MSLGPAALAAGALGRDFDAIRDAAVGAGMSVPAFDSLAGARAVASAVAVGVLAGGAVAMGATTAGARSAVDVGAAFVAQPNSVSSKHTPRRPVVFMS
jgi:hypothetical protein